MNELAGIKGSSFIKVLCDTLLFRLDEAYDQLHRAELGGVAAGGDGQRQDGAAGGAAQQINLYSNGDSISKNNNVQQTKPRFDF